MVWERYCNASPIPEFFLFSLFIFSFISQLIWVRLGWNFHRWFSIRKQVNWCTIDPFSLKFCTSQHSYPVPSTAVQEFFFEVVSKQAFSRECRKALTTSQRLQISFVEIGDEHIFKLKIQKGTWSYLLSIGDRESHFFFLPDDINLDLRAFLHSWVQKGPYNFAKATNIVCRNWRWAHFQAENSEGHLIIST